MAPTRALDRPVKTSGLLSIPHALFHSLKGSGPIALLMKQLLRCRPRYSESRCDIGQAARHEDSRSRNKMVAGGADDAHLRVARRRSYNDN